MMRAFFILLALLVTLAFSFKLENMPTNLSVGGNAVVTRQDATNDTIEYINWVYNATEVDIYRINNPNDTFYASSNANASLAADDPNRGPSKYIALRMGGWKTHVGTLRKQRLWDAIAECIRFTVKPTDRRAIPDHCQLGDGRCETSCTINNIVRNDGYNDRYSSLGSLMVYVDWSEFKEVNHPGLRDAVVKIAAEMYMVQANQPENCYITDFRMSRRTTMCNVLSHALIVLEPSQKSSTDAILSVRVQYNDLGRPPLDIRGKPSSTLPPDGGSQGGTLSCTNIKEPIARMFREHQRAGITQALGTREDNMFPLVNCLDNDKNMACVTVPRLRKVGTGWKEQQGCVLMEDKHLD